uniref:Uncharacterized protein n=1 Tax=Globodera rostochiensis TaxID=31243 RepID=A0A914HVV7_GLORO
MRADSLSSTPRFSKEKFDEIFYSPNETNYTYAYSPSYKSDLGSRDYENPRLCRRRRFPYQSLQGMAEDRWKRELFFWKWSSCLLLLILLLLIIYTFYVRPMTRESVHMEINKKPSQRQHLPKAKQRTPQIGTVKGQPQLNLSPHRSPKGADKRQLEKTTRRLLCSCSCHTNRERLLLPDWLRSLLDAEETGRIYGGAMEAGAKSKEEMREVETGTIEASDRLCFCLYYPYSHSSSYH